MSARKASHRTIFLIVSSGSPLALIASSLRSTSKKPFCPMTRSLHPPIIACGHRVRFVGTWREEFFEVPNSLKPMCGGARDRWMAGIAALVATAVLLAGGGPTGPPNQGGGRHSRPPGEKNPARPPRGGPGTAPPPGAGPAAQKLRPTLRVGEPP